MMHCIANGHVIAAIANLHPPETSTTDELDSFMFQTVGHDSIEAIARCVGNGTVPLFRRPLLRRSVVTNMTYEGVHDEDEVEDLFLLLKQVKESVPDIEAVSTGAIMSNYQRVRVETVCGRLGLQSLAYLWQRDQPNLLQEMIDSDMHVVLVKVAAAGLSTKHLGKSLAQMQPVLHALSEKYGINVCGEGGEYETLTLDCPIYRYGSMQLRGVEIRLHGTDTEYDTDMAPVSFMTMQCADVVEKDGSGDSKWSVMLRQKQDDRLQKRVMSMSPCMIRAYQQQQQPLVNNIMESSQDMEIAGEMDLSSMVYSNPPFLVIPGITIHSTQTKPPNPLSLEQETTIVINTIIDLLSHHNMTPRNVVLVHVHVSDMSMFGELNRVYAKTFGHANPSTRVTVQTLLGTDHDGCPAPRMQMDCYAVSTVSDTVTNGSESSMNAVISIQRDTLHVQSVSYWAPANIGPYSQSVRLNDMVLMAGQIGLVPHTMQVALGDTSTNDIESVDLISLIRQTVVSLRSLDAVSHAMGTCVNEHTITMICYVTKLDMVCAVKSAWHKTQRCHDQYHHNQDEYDGVDNDESGCGRVCPTAYVVVQRLPRDALVEWEPIVYHPDARRNMIESMRFEDDDDEMEHSKRRQVDMGDQRTIASTVVANSIKSEVMLRSAGSTFGCVVTTRFENMIPDHLTNERLSHLAESIVNSMDDIMMNWEQSQRGMLVCKRLTWTSVFSVRVFHLKCVSPNWIVWYVRKAIQDRMKNGGVCPAVTAVVAEALPDRNVLTCVASASLLTGTLSN